MRNMRNAEHGETNWCGMCWTAGLHCGTGTGTAGRAGRVGAGSAAVWPGRGFPASFRCRLRLCTALFKGLALLPV